MIKQGDFSALKNQIAREIKIMKEVAIMQKEFDATEESGEKILFNSQLKMLQSSLKKANEGVKEELSKINMPRNLAMMQEPSSASLSPKIPPSWKVNGTKIPSLPETRPEGIIRGVQVSYIGTSPSKTSTMPEEMKLTHFEKDSIKRLKKKEEKKEVKKEITPSNYKRFANKMFYNFSDSLLKKGHFKGMQRNLTKANMNYLSKSYISIIILSTIISIFVAILIFGFFMMFNFGVKFPFITSAGGSIFQRFLQTFWILIVIPIATFLFAYTYPSIERKSQETLIDNELPFATIHMASIAESLIEPSNIFKIMILTKEYPHLEREFIKIVNEINILGYDLVTALRNTAYNSPSKKLTELLDGLATTITSGGDMAVFFEKRAQSLLFDYKLEKEKQTKSAETFMDIYISVVIAAPMILMLLLIMMRISGLGISLSTSMISLIMVLGVSLINIIFLGFLQLKGQKEA